MDNKIITKRAYEILEERGYNVFSVSLFGSQNYGLDIPESDFDFKAILIPTLDDIVRNRAPISTTLELDGGDGIEHIDLKDIRLYFDLFKKQNPPYMEALFTEWYEVNPLYRDEWKHLRDLGNRIAFADPIKALHAMSGMIDQKAHALCHPYPVKTHIIEKYGYDPKQLSHAYRLVQMMILFVHALKGFFCEDYTQILGLNSITRLIAKQIKLREGVFAFDVKEAVAAMKSYQAQATRIIEIAENFYVGNVDKTVYHFLDDVKMSVIKKSIIKEAKG